MPPLSGRVEAEQAWQPPPQSFLAALPQWTVLLSGWPKRFVALLCGAAGALAMAPVDFAPAMVVSMTAAIWLIDGSARAGTRGGRFGSGWRWRSCRAAAGVGWWWGFGYFIAGLWWLGAAFLVEPSQDAWALPFGVLGVPAVLALFPACGFALARLLWSSGPNRIFALTVGLGLSEYLRSWLFTGFPWNSFGMAFGDQLVLAQAASVIGVNGLTLLVIACCASPATLADMSTRMGFWSGKARWLPPLLALLVVAGLIGFGLHRLDRGSVAAVPGVHLRIMQPEIAQDAAFSYANKDKILADYLELSTRKTSPDMPAIGEVTHLIWPESVFPFLLARDPDALAAIGQALPPQTVLIAGAARSEPPRTPGQEGRYFNSIQVVGPGGVILDSYDKVHLVPFGEYLPFEKILGGLGLKNFVHIPGGFTAGSHRRLLDIPGLPLTAPIICYEGIFSGEVVPPRSSDPKRQPGLLLNVTDDSWFGATAGPYQHFAMARLRAIEQGLPLVRAANGGISAIVDPYGRIVERLTRGTRAVLDGSLPTRIPDPLFARHGSAICGFLFILALIGTFAYTRKRSFS